MMRPGRFVHQINRHARREKRLSLGSFLVLLIILMLVDLFWIASINLNSHYQSLLSTVKMELFITDDYPDSLLPIIVTSLYEITDVASTEFISRDDAALILQTNLGPGILEGLEENPLPRSYIIYFQKSKGLAELDEISSLVKGLEGVQAVDFGRAWIEKVENIGDGFKQIGYAVGGLILFVVLLTMANTNRLTARTKSSEFYQLRLLGAGPSYLLYPFLAEGFFSALFAAGIGWLLIIYFSDLIALSDFSLIFPTGKEVIVYCFVAGLTGMAGAYLGIRRLLLS